MVKRSPIIFCNKNPLQREGYTYLTRGLLWRVGWHPTWLSSGVRRCSTRLSRGVCCLAPKGSRWVRLSWRRVYPRCFCNSSVKFGFKAPSSSRSKCIIYSTEKFCICIFFKDSQKLLNVHLDIKSIHCTY